MKAIWKFPLEVGRSGCKVMMPKGAKVLSVICQRSVICLYAVVDTEAPKEERYFIVVSTGWEFEDEQVGRENLIGTVQVPSYGAEFVFHVFEGI